MIGLDTNVLARYITQDDAKQALIAEELISDLINKEESIFINNIVLCELVWVLSRGYKYTRKQISLVIHHILSTSEFIFENHQLLWETLEEYERLSLDFSDSLISRLNQYNDCKLTYTFDLSASNGKGFQIIGNKS